MFKELHALFTRMGLGEDEAKVLLTLYQHPGSPIGRIAQYAGFKRGHTYDLVASLLSRGLASEVVERGVMRISALAPIQLPARVAKQREDLADLLVDLSSSVSTLEQLAPKLAAIPRVQMFRGSQGVRELYDFTLSSKEKIIRACADFAHLFPRKRSPELNDWLWKYAERRARKGIVYRAALVRSNDSDIAFRKRRAQKRELKLLEGCSLSVEINIFDKYLAVFSTEQEMMGVLIESLPLTESLKSLFEALWRCLPVYNTN